MATYSFKDLIVWQKAMELCKTTYVVCASLPKHETYGLADQLRRAVVSVPSNIAEGQKRLNRQETIQFCGISLGSVAEVETQLLLVQDLYKVDTEKEQEQCQEVARLLTALVRSLRTKI